MIRSWNAGRTAAEAMTGTRGVRTTFQPCVGVSTMKDLFQQL